MKRRNFIKLSATASVIGLTPFQIQAALKTFIPINCPDISGRKLVLVNLAGANDGLNSLVPLNQYDAYSNLRPTIKVPESGLNKYITLDSTLPEEQQVGLNPALASFKPLYEKGILRIVQGVGYPSQNKSHFKSTDLYFTGNDGNSMLNGLDTGWMGRFMEQYYSDLIVESFPLAIEIGSNQTSLGFHAAEAHGLSLNITGQDPAGFYNVISGLGGENPTNIPDSDYGKQLEFISNTDSLTNTYAASISNAFNKGKNDVTYPDTDLADQLKTVARLISGDLESKIYMVRIGGFDTHNAQVQAQGDVLGRHHDLLTELSESIDAFTADLESQNLSEDVVGVTFSEFGRKAAENGNLGTDHGEIAPMFIFGKPVSGGMTGINPDLSEAVQDNNWQIKTVQYDYRQTFATLLQDFLGADNAIIDNTFFNHSLNDSFTNLKIEDILRAEYDISKNCVSNSNPGEGNPKNWLLYPNPCKDYINMSGITTSETVSYRIYNSSGLFLTESSSMIVDGSAEVAMFTLSSGVYFIEILGGKKEIHKIIKI